MNQYARPSLYTSDPVNICKPDNEQLAEVGRHSEAQNAYSWVASKVIQVITAVQVWLKVWEAQIERRGERVIHVSDFRLLIKIFHTTSLSQSIARFAQAC